MALAAALCMPAGTFAFAQSAGQDMHAAGTDTKDAAKDVGHGIAKGTEKAYDATKNGTEKVVGKGKHNTKKAYHKTKHGTKHAAHKTANATARTADKVSDHTQTAPQ